MVFNGMVTQIARTWASCRRRWQGRRRGSKAFRYVIKHCKELMGSPRLSLPYLCVYKYMRHFKINPYEKQEREAGYLRALVEKEAEARELRTTMQEMAAFHRCVLDGGRHVRALARLTIINTCAHTFTCAKRSPSEAWARRVLLDPAVGLELRIQHEKVGASMDIH